MSRQFATNVTTISLRGPKIEKIQDRPPGLKFPIEIEIFKRATHQTPIFVGNSEGPGLKLSSGIEIFNRDCKFQSRLIFFNLWALRVITTCHDNLRHFMTISVSLFH